MDATAMQPVVFEESSRESDLEGQERNSGNGENPEEDSNQIPDDLLDVFTYGVIQNPVKADDGHIYDASSIRSWFDTCRSKGMDIVSPHTKKRMGESLRSTKEGQRKTEVRSRLQKTLSKHLDADDNDPIASVTNIGKIFAAIDPLRDLFQTMSWQPPQIIVLGNEKSGKSTLLERLTMMPVFPKDEDICTRMAIQLRLRRGPAKIPRIEVVDVHTNAKVLERYSALEVLHLDVRDEMDRLVSESNNTRRGVVKDKMLVVYVQNPESPNLDLLDTPGFVQFGASNEPDNMSTLTKEIAELHLQRSAAHSLFLVTVPANENIRNSIGMDLILKKGLQDRAIGVLTKADLCTVNESGAPVASVLRRRLAHAQDLVPLKYGYTTTMNRQVGSGAREAWNYDRLRKQARHELSWFKEHELEDLVAADLGTVTGLVTSLSRMFNEYMRSAWLPSTVRRIGEEEAALLQKDTEMGKPRAHTEEETAGDNLMYIKAESLQTINNLLDDNYPAIYRGFFKEVLSPACDLISTTDFSGVVEYQGIPVRIADMIKNRSQLSEERKAWIESGHSMALKVQSASFQRIVDKHTKWVHMVCEDAIQLSKEFFATKTLAILRNDPSSVKLGRFDNLVKDVMAKLHQLLDETTTVVHKQLKYLVDAFFRTCPSYGFEVKYAYPDADELPTITVTYRAGSLAHTVVHHLLNSGFATLYATLSDHLPDIIEASTLDWMESCASERAFVLKRLGYIEYANRHILKILDIPSDKLAALIQSLETDPNNCKAAGSGLVEVRPLQPATFVIHAYDRRGERQHHGGDHFEVEVPGCDVKDVTVTDLVDGAYIVNYTVPAESIDDIIAISIKIGEEHIRGSPFHAKCFLLTDPTKTLATGEGLVSARPDKEGHFEILAHNRKGHRQRLGGDVFSVTVTGCKDVRVHDMENGSYKVKYLLPSDFKEDEVMISISLSDVPISRSPFRVRCERGCLGRYLRQVGTPGNSNGHLQYPYGVAVDGDAVYVADRNNHRIQVFDKTSGVYLRQFGTRGEGNGQLQYPNGLAVDGAHLYVTEKGNHRVQVFNKSSGQFVRQFGSPGSSNGQFQSPYGVAIHGSHIYVGDFGNHRIQIFEKANGNYLGQFGAKGSGNGQLLYPYGVSVSNGLLFVVDFGNHRVQVFDESSHTYVGQFGSRGDGPGQLQNPNNVTVDEDLVYVTDGSNHRVCVFDRRNGTFIRTFGSMGTHDGQLQYPDGIAIDGGSVFVVDQSNHRVQVFEKTTGTYQRQFGCAGNGKGELLFPHGLAVDNKFVYVAEKGNHRVQVFEKNSGGVVQVLASIESTSGDQSQVLQSPLCVAVDKDNCFITDAANNRVQVYNKGTGDFVRQFGGRGTSMGQFQSIYGVAVDVSFIFVSDYGLHRVQVFDKATGTYLRQFGTPGSGPGQLLKPFGLAVDQKHIYVADNGNYRIQVFDKVTGVVVRQFGTAGNGHGQLQSPDAVSVDGSLLYVTDNSNHRVQVFDKNTGSYVRQFGSVGRARGQLQNPYGVAVDGLCVYVSDGSNHRIQVFH